MNRIARLHAASLCVVLAAVASPALPAPLTIPINPASTQLGYTIYVLGLIPMAGSYQRFDGSVTLDPDHPQSCRVQVTIEVASLRMNNPDWTERALAPDMMDVAHYPIMDFAGRCDASGKQTVGALTMHGRTRPLTLETSQEGDVLRSVGSLRRRDYGIDGLPALVGQQVRLRLTTTRPPERAARAPG